MNREVDLGADWEANRRDKLAAGLALTPAERLVWLEEAIVFAHRAGALPRRRGTFEAQEPMRGAGAVISPVGGMPISPPGSPRREVLAARSPAIIRPMEVVEVRAGARCPVCGARLEAAFDPGSADPWTCPDPACPVTDDASAWMGGGD